MDLVLDEVLSIDDFPSICVACLALARRGRSKFHLINLEYLQELLGGEHTLNDPNAPQHLCLTCFRLCQKWTEFRTKFQLSSVKLKAILEAAKCPATVHYEDADPVVLVKSDPDESIEVIPDDLYPDDGALSNSEEMDAPDEEMDVPNVEVKEEGVEDDNEEEETNALTIPPKEDDSSAAEMKDRYDMLYLECALCQEVIPHCLAYNQHIVDAHMQGGFGVCSLCNNDDTFDSEEAFRAHIYTHTLKLKFNCPVCPRKFKSRTNVRSHLRLQHQMPEATVAFRQCHVCGEQVSSGQALRMHILREHIPPDHTECFICCEKQPTDRLLALHIYSHGYARPSNEHCCEICGLVFRDPHPLKIHMRKHQGPPTRFECDVCDKSYGTQRYLEKHKARHTTEKKFKCDECEKLFYTQVDLKTHQRTHAVDNRSYICSYCGRGFFSTSVRDEHIRIRHTGERRYPCDQCERSYFRRRELEEHQRRHTGEKPFTCAVCGKLYQRKTTLMTHMKIHRVEQRND